MKEKTFISELWIGTKWVTKHISDTIEAVRKWIKFETIYHVVESASYGRRMGKIQRCQGEETQC